MIKMIIKGRSPTMRHVPRTHSGALVWTFDRINVDPKIQINFVDTRNPLADMLTKGSSTRDEWNHLFRLCNIMNFSMFSSIHSLPIKKPNTMSKRAQERRTEGGLVAKPRPACLVSRNSSAQQTSSVDSVLHTAWGIKSWSECGLHKHWETSAGRSPESSNEFSRVAKR